MESVDMGSQALFEPSRAEISVLRSNKKLFQARIKELEARSDDLGTPDQSLEDTPVDIPELQLGYTERKGKAKSAFNPKPEIASKPGPEPERSYAGMRLNEKYENTNPLSGSRMLEDEIRKTVDEGNMILALQESMSKGNIQQAPAEEFPPLPGIAEKRENNDSLLQALVQQASVQQGKKKGRKGKGRRK